MRRLENASLHSKRFRLVSEQRKTEERYSRFLAAREMKQEPKIPALLLAPFFARVLDSRSSLFAPKPHGNACYAG